MSIWGNRDYFKDHFWMIEGGLFGDEISLIRNGVPQNFSFLRAGDVELDDSTVFPANTPVKYAGRYVHHGQVTETTPAYDISPLKRPVAPDVYDTAASSAADLHGLTWDLADAKNRWVLYLLAGVPDGVELSTPLTSQTIVGAVTDVTDDYFTTSQNGGLVSQPLTIGKHYILSSQGDTTAVHFRFYNDPAAPINELCGFGVCGFTAVNTSLYMRNTNLGTTNISYSLQEASPASGTLTLKNWIVPPTVAQWQAGNLNLLSRGDGTPVIYIDAADGKLTVTDGTNICKSLQAYTPGQPHTMSLAFGGDKMQVYLDKVNGPQAPFKGTFLDGSPTLKWGLANEDIVLISDVYGKTTRTFSDAIHLAQDLAQDL